MTKMGGRQGRLVRNDQAMISTAKSCLTLKSKLTLGKLPTTLGSQNSINTERKAHREENKKKNDCPIGDNTHPATSLESHRS